jgi:hypothetical protein
MIEDMTVQLRREDPQRLYPACQDAQVLLGHAKLETTALYAKVATNVIRAVMSPLDQVGSKAIC